MAPKTRKTSAKKVEEKNEAEVEVVGRWEWESDKGWITLPDDISQLIDTHWKTGKSEVSVAYANATKIVLNKMLMKMKSGFERRVRYSISDGTDYYCWQWQDENNVWNCYQPAECNALETSRNQLEMELQLVICGRSYQVDLTKMQQINTQTNVGRKLQRLRSDAVTDNNNSTAADQKPSTSSTAAAGSKSNNRKRTAAATTTTAAAAAAAAAAAESEDEEEQVASKKAKRAASKSATSAKSTGSKTTDNTVKTVVVKGAAPVDPECGAAESCHVYTEGSDIYDVMLNQTNVGNNNNKFYIIQLLEGDKSKQYNLWNRWGRVGFKGQSSLTQCGPDLDQAKTLFCKKFYDKTKNEWSDRKKFVKMAGKYDLVKIDYKCKTNDEPETAKKSLPVPDSKLSKQLQGLIKLICDVKAMESVVMEMKYDAQKAPLGRLTTEQIKAGYAALKRIDACVKNNDFGSRLTEACNDFYTRIPHYFGMSRPAVIRTKAEVKSKLDLLEALGDIEIAMRVLQECKSTDNPIDSHYKSLHCELKLVDKSNPVFKVIGDYVRNTHAPTHNQYKLNVTDVYEVDREHEAKQFVDHGNRMLLWHGSRLTNMVGILSQGLRIAPPEAPVTGYMFGKGIYFADMSSKSANYCFATKTKNTGLLILSEVSLGKCNELLDADPNADKLPKGCHSVKGVGKIAPDPTQNIVWSDGTVIPVGKPVDTGVNNPSGYTLNYNEFIVYNARQVKMRYIVQVEFKF